MRRCSRLATRTKSQANSLHFDTNRRVMEVGARDTERAQALHALMVEDGILDPDNIIDLYTWIPDDFPYVSVRPFIEANALTKRPNS